MMGDCSFLAALILLIGCATASSATNLLEPVVCPSDITTFSTELDIDLVGDATNITKSNEELISQTAVSVYNGLASLVCDPEFHTIDEGHATGDSITVEDDASSTDDENGRALGLTLLRALHFRFVIRGRCRGCGRDAMLFSDGIRRGLGNAESVSQKSGSDNNDRSLRGQQQQQQNHRGLTEVCFCPASSEHHAPTKEDFIKALDDALRVLGIPGVDGAVDVWTEPV